MLLNRSQYTLCIQRGFSITLRHLAWVCRMKKNGSAGTREYMSNKGFLAPSSHPSSHSFFPMNWPSGNDFPDYYSNDSLIMWLANHGLTIHLVHGCKKGRSEKWFDSGSFCSFRISSTHREEIVLTDTVSPYFSRLQGHEMAKPEKIFSS